MTEATKTNILEALKTYLLEHFPDAELDERTDSQTGSVILRSTRGDPPFRLAVSESFLDGDDDNAPAMDRVRQWNVARELRYADRRLVTLTTAGPQIQEPD